MSSHRQILYQIVFGTKNRNPTIVDEQCGELYKYIWGIVKKHNCKLYRINGAADHVYDDLLQSNLKTDQDIDRLDRYLVEKSAEMLNQLGDKKYLSKLDDLDISSRPAH